MDGPRMRFAGVINVTGLRNPILLARQLLEEEDRVLCGEGALNRARELGLEECDVRTRKTIEAFKDSIVGKTGTVGAVAVDTASHLAAATSTGGRGTTAAGEPPGQKAQRSPGLGGDATQPGGRQLSTKRHAIA